MDNKIRFFTETDSANIGSRIGPEEIIPVVFSQQSHPDQHIHKFLFPLVNQYRII